MKMKQLRILALSTAISFFAVAILAATPALAVQRVLVLPFKMNAPQDVTFLQQGILDMFASRLENPGNVQVVSKLEAQQAFKRAGGNIDAATAQNLARGAAANYVLFGSVTVLGNNVSIDAKMTPVTGGGQPLSMFAQAEGMDAVIPKVNQFADEINTKMFGRRSAGGSSVTGGGAVAPVPAPAAGAGDTGPVPAYRRHPESLLTGQEGRGAGNPLNPNFITAVGANQREGKFWRSPSFPAQVIGLCVADVDRDGKNELIYATRSALYIARVSNNGFRRVAKYQGPRGDRFLTLDVADVNGNGVPEIFVSVQRRFDASSLVLEMKGNKLVPIIKDVPYYLRMIHTPEGMSLFGQRSGMGEAFYGGVSYMNYSKDGKELVPATPLALPSGYHIFNFSLAVMSAEAGEFLIGIDKKERLVVRTRGGGGDMWTSDEDFGGTLQYIEMDWADDPERVTKDDRAKRMYFPSRILITDLNKDGRKEILIGKNTRSDPEMIARWRSFKRGSLMSLSYYDMLLRENWRTPRLPGPVIDYQVADYDNDGRDDLVVAVMLEEGSGLEDARSAIAAYELASPEEMRQADQERRAAEGGN